MSRAVLAFTVLLAGLSGCMGGGCNVPPPPESETCDPELGAPRPTVSLVEIGQIQDQTFMPIADDSVVPLVVGGQGSDMVVAFLRVTGGNLSECIPQVTRLELANGELMSSEESALQATRVSDTTWLTGAVLLPWYQSAGQLARIESTVADTTASVTFWTDYRGSTDAPPPDAPIDSNIDGAPDGPASEDAATD